MSVPVIVAWLCLGSASPLGEEEIDRKYPLDAPLRILAGDVKSPRYRQLVTEKMLITDLAAEWQRVETADNPEAFLDKHGGKDKVIADPDLTRAYQRRVEIRKQFLDLMREGYRRYKQVPPFDRGATAELSGTIRRKANAARLNLAPVVAYAGSEHNWPRFRGPSGQGLTRGNNLPVRWDRSGMNVLWRTKIPGQGNSSPIVWGDRVFVTGSDARGKERCLYCFRRTDGRLLWGRKAPSHTPEPGVRNKNGYASATPVTDGERVIAFFGSSGLVCFDFDGKLIWHHDALRFQTTHGTGSSPLLYKDMVIFAHDQNQADSVFLALDKHTGKVLWQRPRKKAMTWSTPIVVRVGDHDEVVFAGGETVKGYDPQTGTELWSLTGPTQEVIPTLLVGKDLLFSASGRNGPILALLPGGSGDVSATHLVWRTVRGGPHVPSPILVGNRLYVVNDTGIASCFDAETGQLIWQERLHDNFSASPVEAAGLLYFPSESGVTYVLRATDRFDVVAQNDLGEPLLASPAVIEDQLILRAADELFCIGNGKSP